MEGSENLIWFIVLDVGGGVEGEAPDEDCISLVIPMMCESSSNFHFHNKRQESKSSREMRVN